MSASTLFRNAIAEPIAIPRSLQFKAGSIVGLIDRPGQLSGLIAALANAGIARNKIEIVRATSPATGQPGVIDRIAGFLNVIGPERELARQYDGPLSSGAIVVAVHATSNGRQDAVASILKAAGGHYIHSFGRFTVRTLVA